jgi:hypothetical protein
MLIKYKDLNKNREISVKRANGSYMFVGWGDVVDEKIVKENDKFIYFESGMRLRKGNIC